MSKVNFLGKGGPEEIIDFAETFPTFQENARVLLEVRSVSEAVQKECIAERQISICEKLLRSAIPADEELLRNCGVNLEELKERCDRARTEKTLIAIDSDMDIRILTEIDRFLLCQFKSLLLEGYKAAIITKMLAISANKGKTPSERRTKIINLKAQYSKLLTETHDVSVKEEIDGLVYGLLNSPELEDITPVGRDDSDRINVRCPCCGEMRSCKPFEEMGQLVMISAPGRIPYEGVLFCPECQAFCCGMQSNWKVTTKGRENFNQARKSMKLPKEADLFIATCRCGYALFTLPGPLVNQLSTIDPDVLRKVLSQKREQQYKEDGRIVSPNRTTFR